MQWSPGLLKARTVDRQNDIRKVGEDYDAMLAEFQSHIDTPDDGHFRWHDDESNPSLSIESIIRDKVMVCTITTKLVFDSTVEAAADVCEGIGNDCRIVQVRDENDNVLHNLHDEAQCSRYVDFGTIGTRSGVCCPVRAAVIDNPAFIQHLLDNGCIVQVEYGSPPFLIERTTGTTKTSLHKQRESLPEGKDGALWRFVSAFNV